MNSIRNYMVSALLLCIAYYSSAQKAEGKSTQAGLTANFGVNMISPGLIKKFDKDGLNSNIGIGLIINTSFKGAPNLGLSTGIEFDFDGAKFQTKDSIFYDYFSNEILTNANSGDKEGTFYLQSRNQKTIYATVPLMMIFRTQYIGDFRYFGKFGLRNSFLLQNLVNDEGVEVLGLNQFIAGVENLKYENPGEVFIYKGSVGISGGAEWKFIESTSLVAEFGYYYGFTPLYSDRKDVNKTLYEINSVGEKVYLSNKATQNQFVFKLSLLF